MPASRSFRPSETLSGLVASRRSPAAGYLDLLGTLAGYPNGDYHALSNAGHYLPFEQPLRFRGLVRDWLTRMAPEAATG